VVNRERKQEIFQNPDSGPNYGLSRLGTYIVPHNGIENRINYASKIKRNVRLDPVVKWHAESSHSQFGAYAQHVEWDHAIIQGLPQQPP
jgi:hypothetical protein